MNITDWTRAGVAGATADGRDIAEQAILDIATSYSQETYNARIWPEHIRGIAPDGIFKALGDVVQVKAERISSGALAGKMALYVKLAPHQDLIAMVRNGQKVHLSMEIEQNFAATGKAYLVGLGATDSPASLGTGIMKFSTAERKTSLFSTPLEADIKEPSTPTGGADYSLQFTQLQSQNTALLQQFTAMSAELSKLLAEVGNLKASIKETHTIVEEIGNASSGRFRPYTRNKFASDSSSSDSQKVDY
jgi:hypothetical protein